MGNSQAIIKITHISIPHAYMVQRFAFIFLAFLCFHYYMRKWLSPGESFAGVAFLAAVMPLTYGGDLQESAPLLMLLFVLVYGRFASIEPFCLSLS